MVVAGNSIGGFISASLAADYPGLVQGLVLLNSAGGCVAAVGDGAAAQHSWGQNCGVQVLLLLKPSACCCCADGWTAHHTKRMVAHPFAPLAPKARKWSVTVLTC